MFKMFLSKGGLIAALLIIIAILLALLSFARDEVKEQKALVTRYKENTISLMSDVERFKVQLDNEHTLSAARINQLTMALDEYKAVRNKDIGIIKQLQNDIRDLKSATNVEIISKDSVPAMVEIVNPDTISAAFTSEWIDLYCQIIVSQKTGYFEYSKKEEVKIFREIPVKKLFWGLIRLKKQKQARVTAISLDPNSEIISVEYIEVVKK